MNRYQRSLIITNIILFMFVLIVIGILAMDIQLIIGTICIGIILIFLTQSVYIWCRDTYFPCKRKQKKLSNMKDKNILDFEYEDYAKDPDSFIDIEEE